MALPVEPPLRAMETSVGRRVRLPRMAEVVADSLRASILSGQLTVVPRLEDLIDQFNVGPPAVREAMRILETEGLVTVRRGNVGGADVHLPTDDRVSYMVSLVLQSKGTKLRDVGAALRELEPVCAVMCAQRQDRGETIVPGLRAVLAEQGDAIGDRARTMQLTDRFHDLIVQGCGNDTMIVVIGSLERVWAGHATAVYSEDATEVAAAVWKASLRDHQRIADAIERGDPRVGDLAARHLDATQAYMSAVADSQVVNASALHR